MANLLRKTNFDTALTEEVADLGGSGFGVMMKFDANTSKYSIIGGGDVEIGRRYIAHVDQYARGHVKFVDKRPVDWDIKRLVEGEPKKREDLDEPELADKVDDPWVYQRYLPLEDIETSEIVVFVSKSVGAKIAFSNLLQTYKIGSHRGKPIVKLAIGSFNTRDYGRRARPDFAIVGWTGGNVMPAMNEEGPPPTESGDPGYDLSALDR